MDQCALIIQPPFVCFRCPIEITFCFFYVSFVTSARASCRLPPSIQTFYHQGLSCLCYALCVHPAGFLYCCRNLFRCKVITVLLLHQSHQFCLIKYNIGSYTSNLVLNCYPNLSSYLLYCDRFFFFFGTQTVNLTHHQSHCHH